MMMLFLFLLLPQTAHASTIPTLSPSSLAFESVAVKVQTEEGVVHELANPDAKEEHHGEHHGHNITHQMMILVLQLAVILMFAKLLGEVFERFLKQPAVLGELTAGMIIGPYALGTYLDLPGVGVLFPALEGALPVSAELYGVATIASIVLLFLVGLETDFKQFLKYSGPGAVVGVGGVVFSFLTGAYCYVLFTGEPFMSPAALFMGTVSTATSVGITARVLSEKRKLDSPEGTTILAGAVIDDVLGILILAIVGGIAVASNGGDGHVDWGSIGMIAVKAIGFWLVATVLGILLSPQIAKGVSWFRSPGATVAMGFGLALLLAGIAEMFGLAMIIGAYIMGLSLSRETLSHHLEEALAAVYACFVPIFFAVMGMLVDFSAMMQAIGFGLVYSLIAVIAKVLGGGLPCLLVGFNGLGALRVGLGMLPRGEVALIVAGVGMAQGYIDQSMFGVVIMMTLITTLIAPPALVGVFSIDRKGIKSAEPEPEYVYPEYCFRICNLDEYRLKMMWHSMRQLFENKGFVVKRVGTGHPIFELRGTLNQKPVFIIVRHEETGMVVDVEKEHFQPVRELTGEALAQMRQEISQIHVEELTAVAN